MHPDREYAIEKLGQATMGLATGRGDVKDRLVSAGLTLTIRGDDYAPPEFRDDLVSIRRDLQVREPEIEGESRLEATVRKLSPEEAAAIAQRIFSLYHRLMRDAERAK
jgi:hypothetical protein